MKLIIIGSNGMLGSMLCEVFAEYQPLCVDKDQLDITDLEAVRIFLREHSADVIINAAAYTAVDDAEENRELAFAINAQGIENLATICKEQDCILVHYSTDYVFTGDNQHGYTEESSPGPAVNAYGESKLAGEQALVQIKPNFYLQRIAWLYGPDGPNFVDTMLNLAKQHSELTVVNDQYGSPTFTKDVALATKYLLENTMPYGIYHTVNEGVASWFDFAGKIFAYNAKGVIIKPVSSDQFPRPAKRPQYSVLQNTKGVPMRKWDIALKDYLDNYYR